MKIKGDCMCRRKLAIDFPKAKWGQGWYYCRGRFDEFDLGAGGTDRGQSRLFSSGRFGALLSTL